MRRGIKRLFGTKEEFHEFRLFCDLCGFIVGGLKNIDNWNEKDWEEVLEHGFFLYTHEHEIADKFIKLYDTNSC